VGTARYCGIELAVEAWWRMAGDDLSTMVAARRLSRIDRFKHYLVAVAARTFFGLFLERKRIGISIAGISELRCMNLLRSGCIPRSKPHDCIRRRAPCRCSASSSSTVKRFATLKLGLLRVLWRGTDGSAGMALDPEDNHVALPNGLIALNWIWTTSIWAAWGTLAP